MTPRQTLYLSVVLLITWFLAITLLRKNLAYPVRYFSDESDRTIYYERGAWFQTGQVPYRDVISEYPQVPTFLFGLFYIFTWGEKNETVAYLKFTSFFVLAMLLCLFALINQIYRLLPSAKYRAYLLLLPAPLYFTLNRFDILAAYLCILSFVMVTQKKWGVAAIILGIATMTKWYPVLLLPAYLAYSYRTEGGINWRMILFFAVSCFVIILPTLLLGGIGALLVPYRFQGVRELETLSLPAMIRNVELAISQNPIDKHYYTFGFLFLQGIACLVSLFARINKPEKLLQWCLLIITMFVLFARIYSPQWLLWILPFLILTSKSNFDVAVIMLYGILTYVEFPIFYDLFGETSSQMIFMSLINIVLLTIIAVQSITRIWSFEKNFLHPKSLHPLGTP